MKKWMGIILTGLFMFTGCGNDQQHRRYTGIVEGKVYSLATTIAEKIVCLPREEGESVAGGEIVCVLDTSEIALQSRQLQLSLQELEIQRQQLQLQLQMAEDQFRYASDLLEKNRVLSRDHAVPAQKLEDLQLQRDNAWKQKVQLEKNLELIGLRLEQNHVQLQLLDQKRKKAVISSPVDGVVDRVNYEEGEIPAPMSPILEVVNLDTVWCYIYLSETDLATIHPGQPVTVRVDGVSQTMKGQVAHINQTAEFTPKNILTPDNRKALVYGVKIFIANQDDLLKPGMPVEVEL